MYRLIPPQTMLAVMGWTLRRAISGNSTTNTQAERDELNRLITTCIPHGSLRWAEVKDTAYGLMVAVQIQGEKQQQEARDGEGIRLVDPEAFVLFIALTFYGGHSHIKNVSDRRIPLPVGAHPNHYAYVFEDSQGCTWQHVIAGAGRGQEVKLGDDHKDLCTENLCLVTPDPQGTPRDRTTARRTWKDRSTVVGEALRLYGEASRKAAAKGHTLPLTRSAYEALLWAIFKLLDDTHGHKLKRLTTKDAAD